jgi:hypothetical protein
MLRCNYSSSVRSVQGIVPRKLAAIRVRFAGSQTKVVSACASAINAVIEAGLGSADVLLVVVGDDHDLEATVLRIAPCNPVRVHDLHASCLLAGAGHGASKAPTGRARKRASRGDSLVDGLDLIAAVVGDDANSGALCERRHDLPGESQDSRLTRRTVADHES